MKFLKKLFGFIKSKEAQENGQFLNIRLNDKMMPMDRGDVYEDPLNDLLVQNKIGEVTGGGTLQFETGEIKFCDLEVYIKSEKIDSATIDLIINKVEELGAPKGSSLIIEKSSIEISLGKLEGIGIYLDAKNLPEEVYKENDVNEVIGEIIKLLKDKDETLRYWEGEKETALYFYGESFNQMSDDIKSFLNSHPLCKNARIDQIA